MDKIRALGHRAANTMFSKGAADAAKASQKCRPGRPGLSNSAGQAANAYPKAPPGRPGAHRLIQRRRLGRQCLPGLSRCPLDRPGRPGLSKGGVQATKAYPKVPALPPRLTQRRRQSRKGLSKGAGQAAKAYPKAGLSKFSLEFPCQFVGRNLEPPTNEK